MTISVPVVLAPPERKETALCIRLLKVGILSLKDNEVEDMMIRRGDIFYADLRPVVGSEQGGVRPVLIIQNDVGNRHSPTVICAAITSQMNKAKLPTHVELDSQKYDLVKDSVVLLEQLRTIDKKRLKDKVCHLDNQILVKIDKALEISLELYT